MVGTDAEDKVISPEAVALLMMMADAVQLLRASIAVCKCGAVMGWRAIFLCLLERNQTINQYFVTKSN
jgi:hypothetical protein